MAGTTNDSALAADTISAEGKKKIFPFMKPSGELRNRIYNHYFQDVAEKTRTSGQPTKHGERTILYSGLIRPFLPLIQISNETRKEASSLLFKDHLAGRHWVTMVCHGPTMLKELRDFCAIVKPWNQDLVFEICFSNCWTHHPLTIGFYDTIVDHLAGQLNQPAIEPMSATFKEWEKVDRYDEKFVCTAEFEGEFSVLYEYSNDREVEELAQIVGPLAKVDWTRFDFDFPKYVRPDWLVEMEAEMGEMEAGSEQDIHPLDDSDDFANDDGSEEDGSSEEGEDSEEDEEEDDDSEQSEVEGDESEEDE